MATKRKQKRATRKKTTKQTVRRFGWTRYVIVMVVALGLLFAAANRKALAAAEAAGAEAKAMAGQLEAEKASVEAKVEEATREAEARRAELHEAVVAVLDELTCADLLTILRSDFGL